jgi:glyoxylase-like metal-dependent hydrolase (beta-lactamase superfamily II)
MQAVELEGMRIRNVLELPPAPRGAPPEYFGNLTPEAMESLQRHADPRIFHPGGGMAMSTHSFVLEIGGKRILIDTCNGEHKSRSGMVEAYANLSDTLYLANLAALGLIPDDIDMVMCTHLHSDHVGWNTRLENGKWVPTFANATYLFARGDVEFAQVATGTQAELIREPYEDSVLPVIKAGQAQIVDPGHVVEKDLGYGLWLEGAPGHTPGAMVLHAECGKDHAMFTGDMFHVPAQVHFPEVCLPGVDHDAEAAMGQRRRVVDTYADTNVVICAAHFPDPTAGRIVRVDGGTAFRFLQPA